jgi:superfamily I DNA and RNA helicase
MVALLGTRSQLTLRNWPLACDDVIVVDADSGHSRSSGSNVTSRLANTDVNFFNCTFNNTHRHFV